MLLFCSQNSLIPRNASVEEIFKALSLFERHTLESGSLSAKLTKDTKLWLLRLGEILHSDGRTLTPGNIYVNPKQGSLQATQPTIAYSLSNANWQTAQQHWPQLAELIDFQERQLGTGDWELGTGNEEGASQYPIPNSLHPIPQPDPELKPKQKIQRAYFPSPTVTARHWWGRLTKRYPFFEQQSSSDCGAACLSNDLSLLG